MLDQKLEIVQNYFDVVNKKESYKSFTLKYWTRHNRLQNWMYQLFTQKLNNKEIKLVDTISPLCRCYSVDIFNCQKLPLVALDIIRLKEDIVAKDIGPCITRFGWGSRYTYTSNLKEEDLLVCDLALEIIKKGGKIVYSSWW